MEVHEKLLRHPAKGRLPLSLLHHWMEIVAATDCAPLSVVSKSASFPNMSLEDQALFDSYIFVDLWRRFEFNAMEATLLKYKEFVLLDAGSKTVLNARMHFKLCTRLLAFFQKNVTSYSVQSSNTLAVLGDSHSLVPVGKTFSWDGKYVTAKTFPIRGLKMFHLGETAPRKWRSYFSEKIKHIPPGCDLLLSVGEIDCRPDEGIFSAAQKGKGISLQSILEKTVSEFITYIQSTLSSQGREFPSITLMGVPRPFHDIRKRLANPNLHDQFLDFIAQANTTMREGAFRAGWGFLDVFSATRDNPPSTYHDLYLDDFHLSPGFYDQAEKWLLWPERSGNLTIQEALRQAISHHQAGRLQDAEGLYRAILKTNPGHPDANHNLGVLALQVERPDAALPLLQKALDTNPTQGQYWISYVEALLRTGQVTTAKSVLQEAKRRGIASQATRDLEARLVGSLDSLPADHAPAIHLRERGEYEAALDWLRDWLAEHPQDAVAHAHVSQLRLLLGQGEQALGAIQEALSIAPCHPLVQRNWARLQLKQQKYVEALRAAESAWRSNRQDPENQLVLAAAQGALGQTENALLLLEEVLRAKPDYAEAFAYRGILRNHGGRYAEAKEDIQRALAIKPHLTHLWGLLGSLCLQTRDFSGAVAALQRALEHDPDDVAHLLNLGELQRQAGSIEKAIELLEKAAQLAPDNAAACCNLGAALQEAKRISEARRAYAKALAINPQQSEVLNNLGVLATAEEDWPQALKYFEGALALQPKRADVMANMVNALNVLERYEEAEVTARKALEEDGGYLAGHLALAATLGSCQRFEEAEAILDAAVSRAAGNQERSRVANSYLSICRAQRHWQKAEEWARRALDLDPDAAEPLINFGEVLQEQGRLEEATTHYRRALASPTDSANAYGHLGNVFKELAAIDEAMDAYRQAVSLDPRGKAGLGAAVRLGVLFFLRGDWERAARMVSLAEPLRELAGRHLRPARAYLKFLGMLLDWWDRNKDIFPKIPETKILHVIGDSHCLTTQGGVVWHDGGWVQCRAAWIEGCKQWSLGNPGNNRYKRAFEINLQALPPESAVLLVFGEIDCRHDEGILRAWKKNRARRIEDIVAETTAGYVRYVAQKAAERGHRPIVSGVPASNAPLENLVPEDREMFLHMLQVFNATLREQALEGGMDFVDVFSLTDSGNGRTEGQWHLDAWHLRPDAMKEAFALHYRYAQDRS